MKPITLVMNAYGPYGGKVEIPFEQLGERGLFLITGDTGSGKTTIFDAITYALFGMVSGSTRTVNTLRSDFALNEEKTFVEFVFFHKNERYKVIRTPQYERPKKRGNGFVTQAVEAELLLPSGKVITKVKEVDEAIEKILGLDYKQWIQIGMIAQGEFLKLLNADSKTRSDIFRKVFHTDFFLNIQQRLTQELSICRKEKEAAEQRLLQYTDGILLEEDSEKKCVFTEWQKEKNQYLIDEILTLLEEQLEEDRIVEKHWENKIQQYGMELRELTRKKAIAEESNRLFIQLDEALKEKTLLDEQYDKIQNKKQRVSLSKIVSEKILPLKQIYKKSKDILEREGLQQEELHQKLSSLNAIKLQKEKSFLQAAQMKEELNKFIGEIATLKERIPQYELSEKLKQERDRLSIEEKRFIEEIKKSQEINETLKKEKELRKDIGQNHLSCTLSLEKKRAEEQKLKEKADALSNLISQIDHFHMEEENYILECRKYEMLDLSVAELQTKCIEEEHRYLREQAGVLAQTLQDGEPCPVCGSKEHPNKAMVSKDAITKEMLNKMKQNVSEQLKRLQEAGNHLAEKKERTNQGKKQIIFDYNKIFKNKIKIISLEDIKTCVIQEEQETGNQLTDNAKEIISLINQLDEILKEEKHLQKVEKMLLQQEMNQAGLQQQLQEYKEELAALDGRLLTIQKHGEIKDIKTAKQELYLLEKKKSEMEEIIKTVENEYQKIEKECYELKAVLLEKDRILPQMKSEYQLAFDEYLDALNKCGINEEECSNIEQNKIHLQEEEREVEIYDQQVKECALLIGQLMKQTKGKEKISLEEYFNQIQILEEEDRQTKRKKEQVTIRLAQNLKTKENMIHAKNDAEEKQQRFAMVKELSDTANGNLAGKQKIAFESFVQGAYFDWILYHANQRFGLMTNGRYQLKKRENAMDLKSQSGLDLDVADAYTGKARTVKSLSGGESFKAALSLALGLSDVIQSSLGGIQMDTLFIDEGFGSLDSDSIQQAMQVLAQLTEGNRLIGIISHVDELKRCIDKKIIVRGKSIFGKQSGSELEVIV
ncbi:AAA family ATPase [Anaerovorax sp. IOR16]|uniref:AAA family ATPase n=1 Tax=Anaerovorax sp. IOR16 TaxID=2773458 RepID=UPI0019D222B4|nr:SbcC/MukB-like Walker B domain-containing protein [Anaerovorax sp. IOR16]